MKKRFEKAENILLQAGAVFESRPALFFAARLIVGIFILMTAGYCVLAYIPFSYHWILNGSIASWVRQFGSLQPFFYWPVLGLAVLSIAANLRRREARNLTLGFIAVHSFIGLYLMFRPLLKDLPNDDSSLRWGLIALFPMLWMAVIDYTVSRKAWRPSPNQDHLNFVPFALWVTFLTALYTAICYFRFGASQLPFPALLFVIAWSAASHCLLVTLLYTALRLVRWFANRFAQAVLVEFWLCNGLIGVLLFITLRYLVFSSISFDSAQGTLFAAAVSLSTVAFCMSLSLRLDSARESASGLNLVLMPVRMITPRKPGFSVCFFWLLALTALAYYIPVSVAVTDWVFLMQKLSVLLIWSLSFVFFYTLVSHRRRNNTRLAVLLIIALAAFAMYRLTYLSRHHLSGLFASEQMDASQAIERYADYELSFKVTHAILNPTISFFPTVKSNTETGEGEFYDFLKQNTHIPQSVSVEPTDIKLTERLAFTDKKKPNIFIFVIDSLRQDYVSPYNQAVTFTPAIANFASESLVMENSFTRYAGTAFSEPSLWVGGMLLHKEYIEPFYPMNSLQKLLEAENYEMAMTIDPVLQIIVKPSAKIVEMDKGLDWTDYDLCKTVEQTKQFIEERGKGTKPLFVYTQAQNLHIVMRNHRKRMNPPNEADYPGFDAFYATQVRHIDSCFGEFISYLKEQNLYDNSIVILTSDHGDDLGESGRWGHGYYLYPELIRIPMIVHVPPRLLKGMTWDQKAVTFTTDITPSLYYLLEHRPLAYGHIFGRPLFTQTEKERKEYLQDDYLLGSSYGAVYGILSDNGRKLYMADSTTNRDYFFNLEADPKGQKNQINEEVKTTYRKITRERILEINRFYKFDH